MCINFCSAWLVFWKVKKVLDVEWAACEPEKKHRRLFICSRSLEQFSTSTNVLVGFRTLSKKQYSYNSRPRRCYVVEAILLLCSQIASLLDV